MAGMPKKLKKDMPRKRDEKRDEKNKEEKEKKEKEIWEEEKKKENERDERFRARYPLSRLGLTRSAGMAHPLYDTISDVWGNLHS